MPRQQGRRNQRCDGEDLRKPAHPRLDARRLCAVAGRVRQDRHERKRGQQQHSLDSHHDGDADAGTRDCRIPPAFATRPQGDPEGGQRERQDQRVRTERGAVLDDRPGRKPGDDRNQRRGA